MRRRATSPVTSTSKRRQTWSPPASPTPNAGRRGPGTLRRMEDADRLWERTIWGEPVDPPFDPAQPPAPGRLDVRVLYQPTWWVDHAGRCLLIAEMSPSHRRNLLLFLAARCRELHRLEAAWDALGAGVSAGAFLGQVASGAPATHQLDPFDWLEALPLMRALRAITPDAPAPAALRAWADTTRR